MVNESPIALLLVLISVTAVLLGICIKLFIRAAHRGESDENDSSIQGLNNSYFKTSNRQIKHNNNQN